MTSSSLLIFLVCFSLRSVMAELVQRMGKGERLCMHLAKEPFFELDMVVVKPWRVLYLWNSTPKNNCLRMSFSVASAATIRRFYYDMNEYLEEQPLWGAASLLLEIGNIAQEILLFDDPGPAGRFQGVANVIRGPFLDFPAVRKSIPLFYVQLKLVEHGKYLIVMDCRVGLVSLCGRLENPINRTEIDAIAKQYAPEFGTGYHTCVKVENTDEITTKTE